MTHPMDKAAELARAGTPGSRQALINAVSKAMQRIYDDPIARESGIICTNIMKSVFADQGWVPADRLAELQARVAELERGWQPIETAPKDGTKILGAYVRPGSVHHQYSLVRWGGVSWLAYADDAPVLDWEDGLGSEYVRPDLTHWWPLPAPPISAEGE